MNKYIVRTSLVWLALIAIVLSALYLRSRQPARKANGNAETLAASPASVAPAQAESTAPAPAAVKPGEIALAPIQLTSGQMQAIGVRVGTAEYRDVASDLRATGIVAIDERLLSYVQVRFSGYIRRVFADATYDYLKKGQPLFTIYSPDLLATQQEYLLARQNEKQLSHSPVEGVSAGAGSLANAAEQRLKQWELPTAELARLQQSGKVEPDVTITSRVSGYITERSAVPEMYVDPSTRLYTVADLSRVWVNAQIFQNNAGQFKPGDPASITVDAYPGHTFRGRVEQVLPQVDVTTRTVQVRLSIANPGLRLKPGMFVNVALKSGIGRQLTVPASAIFQTGTQQIVFLDQGSGTFVPQAVTVGPQVGDQVVILSGLRAHQAIVTSANFLLDSESQLQAAAGVPATAASPQDQPANQANAIAKIDFTTEPAPPRKGSNLFRVKLTNSSGAPLEGAAVTVTFYMPAMPAMGMSAMKTSITLAAKDRGVYEGRGDLGSGGSWQVTITAQQNGHVVATKQMRVDTEGSM